MEIKCPKNNNRMAGLILIAVAVIIAIASVVICYVQNGEFGMDGSDIVIAAVLLILGIILLFVRIKAYGWLIPIPLLLLSAIGSVIEFDGAMLAFSGILFLGCLGMFIHAQIKR